MENSSERLTEIFFYGLYMDAEILRERGVSPRKIRIGRVAGRKLRIGNNSTLLMNENAEAHGIVCSLTHSEIYALYGGCGLNQYQPEAVIVKTEEQDVPALCYVLLDPPANDEGNEAYFQKLSSCMKKYGMPVPVEV